MTKNKILNELRLLATSKQYVTIVQANGVRLSTLDNLTIGLSKKEVVMVVRGVVGGTIRHYILVDAIESVIITVITLK